MEEQQEKEEEEEEEAVQSRLINFYCQFCKGGGGGTCRLFMHRVRKKSFFSGPCVRFKCGEKSPETPCAVEFDLPSHTPPSIPLCVKRESSSNGRLTDQARRFHPRKRDPFFSSYEGMDRWMDGSNKTDEQREIFFLFFSKVAFATLLHNFMQPK